MILKRAVLVLLTSLLAHGALAQRQNAALPAGDPAAGTVNEPPHGEPVANPPIGAPPPKGNGEPADSKTETASEDALFNELHAENLAEIQEGKLAQAKATSKRTRRYGKRLVRDHTAADRQVVKAANRLVLTLSDTLPTAQQSEINQLSRLPASDFDRAFAQLEADRHDRLIADVERAQRQLNDRLAQQLAAQYLSQQHQHAREARALLGPGDDAK